MVLATSKQEFAYDTLRRRILDGTYRAGHRLVIGQIARELEVSPLPVREAIRRLEAEGWVLYQLNQGAEVAEIDSVSWVETLAALALIEGYVTALAAPHVTPSDIEQLRETNASIRVAIEDVDIAEIARLNRSLHQSIGERCPNAYLRTGLAAIYDRLSFMTGGSRVGASTRGRAATEEHENLIDLIAAGADPLEIEMAAREHKLRTVRAVEERLRAGEER